MIVFIDFLQSSIGTYRFREALNIHPIFIRISLSRAHESEIEKGAGIMSYFRSPIEINGGTNSRVFQSHSEDRSFWKPMRRDGGDRWIPRSPWPMPMLVYYPLSSDRFQDRDTDNTDDRCRTARTENRRWQCDGVEHRRLIYLVECNGRPFVASIAFSWILRRIRDCRNGRREKSVSEGCFFRETTTIKQHTNTQKNS